MTIQLRPSTPSAYTFSFNSLHVKDYTDTQDYCLLSAPCAAAVCPKLIHVRTQTVPTSSVYASMATRRTHNKTRLGCHQCKRRRIKVRVRVNRIIHACEFFSIAGHSGQTICMRPQHQRLRRYMLVTLIKLFIHVGRRQVSVSCT